MEEFSEEIRKFILDEELIRPGDSVLVACSGGADSVALLRILHGLSDDLDFELGVAHLNHEIRPEAEEDYEFVRIITRELSLKFHYRSIDVPAYAESNGMTLEEAARDVRYDFLSEIAEENGYERIAVGHNLDDKIETVLFNLIRGTGLTGLSGIQPKRDRIIRPLLRISKKAIREWLKRRGHLYMEDTSNRDIRYTRNRIRNRLLPYLKRNFNPQVEQSIDRLSNIVAEIDDYISQEVQNLLPELIIEEKDDKIVLDFRGFNKYHLSLKQNIVRRILRDITVSHYAPDYKSIEDFIEFCELQSKGQFHFKGGVIAELIDDKIVFGILNRCELESVVHFPGVWERRDLGVRVNGELLENVPSSKSYKTQRRDIAFFDYEKLGQKTVIRNVRIGDQFRPLGMSGNKKVMDILAENGVPIFLRRSQLVLISRSKIAWLIGFRTSDDFKIDNKTDRVLKLTYEERNFN
ncbi:MAG: tRNA lysidine(34) synthetase TilS [candidate division Zixibacteria bacterium]|nr:tRNA lysidine(34) synthetase TilS [candidate division Zixibacteria bacterium]